jgi:hypothetical protein
MKNELNMKNEEMAKLVAKRVYNPGSTRTDHAIQFFVEDTVLSEDCQGYTAESLEKRILAHLNTIDKS